MTQRAITIIAGAALLCSSAAFAWAQDRTIPSDDIVEQTPPIDLRPGQTLDQPRGAFIIEQGRSAYVPMPQPPIEYRMENGD